MIRIAKLASASRLRQTTISNWLSRTAFTLIAVSTLALATTNANASCGFAPAGVKAPSLPAIAHAGVPVPENYGWGNGSIVGLWHVTYTAGGELFNDTFDTWHADGTEFESAFLPTETGNICVGAWKPVRDGKIKLHHVGWLFSSGTTTASGSFTLDELNSVSPDGSCYTGSFTFQVYDINGNPQGDPVTGTMVATRITAD
jgi:hypothetical protein